jgi:hypothetical protein
LLLKARVFKIIYLPSAIALTGQAPAQEPQETHFAASTALLPSFSAIAFMGQDDSHAPQFTQTSGLTL